LPCPRVVASAHRCESPQMKRSRKPAAPVLVDFESRSRCNLRKRGGRLYWEDPSSEAICAVLHDTETGEVTTWEPGDPAPRLAVGVAHNADGFDRFAAAASGWHVAEWIDSAKLARRAGLPGALDALGTRWLGTKKDKASSRFTVALSKPSRARAKLGQLPELTSEVRKRVLDYCASDVEILAGSWERLSEWQELEPEVAVVDRAVNDRGVYLDKDLVHALQKQFERQQERAIRRAAKRLGWTEEETRATAMSPKQLCAMTGLPNAQKGTLAEFDPASPPDYMTVKQARRALELLPVRKALASVVPGKLAAALTMCSDDNRLRDMFLYYGAHTGRWSGRGLQPHNLPRISFEEDAKRIGWHVDEYIDALIDGAMTGEDLTKHQVSGLLRSVLTATPDRTLCVLDYSGIEARGLAWAAGDDDAIEVFKAFDAGTGRDPYCIMASTLFGFEVTKEHKPQRGLGKIAELMLQYGAGADAFTASCEKDGADLDALDISADDVVTAYRKEAHPAIARLWKDCEKAFAAACQGRARRAGKWTYEAHPAADGKGGVDVWCVLPSGRPIVYTNATVKPGTRKTKDGRSCKVQGLSYQGRRFREHVYGGLLVENATQALCRDLLADALVRCEDAGLDPVGHVHDEGICEVDFKLGAEGLEAMREIMSSPPRWARGLPIRLDGFHSVRYRK
jgi:DNA polymerase